MLRNIDKKDLAILRELDLNVRASNNQIGKKTKLSKEVVQYRVKKLEEKGIINNYWALLNIGYEHIYKILIKNRNLFGKDREEFIKFVRNNKIASWFAETEGNFDYIITLFSESDKKIVEFIEKLFSKYGSHFQEKHILKTTSANLTNEKYLHEGKHIYTIKLDLMSGKKPEDKKDEILLTELSKNSRIKFTELAKKMNLSSEAVSQRYKKLVKQKMIKGLKVRPNFTKLGLSYYHLFIALRDQTKRQELIAFYNIHPDANAMMTHIGYYDVHFEFILPDKKIRKVMEELLEKFGDSISSYELLNIREEFTLSILK